MSEKRRPPIERPPRPGEKGMPTTLERIKQLEAQEAQRAAALAAKTRADDEARWAAQEEARAAAAAETKKPD
jgi:hypothetical protein